MRGRGGGVRGMGVTHPFTVLSSFSQHLLKGSNRQGLLQHKVTNTQVWRNILQAEGEEEREEEEEEGNIS